jgi:hypothetical protein
MGCAFQPSEKREATNDRVAVGLGGYVIGRRGRKINKSH